MEADFLLKMQGICKSFPGTVALDNVDFFLKRGEVHLLMGENGAGKSTMLKILSGAYTKDSGEIILDGQQVQFNTPRHARDSGIRIIYQELSLVQGMTVAQNIFLGNEFRNQAGFVDKKKMHKKTSEILSLLGIDVQPDQLIKNLTVGQQQLVEIARNIKDECKILIMDEPTSALSELETKKLFKVVRTLKGKGVGIIYVSHRLEETTQIGDRVTVFKDGKVVGTRNMEDVDINDIIKMMVGNEVYAEEHKNRRIGTEIALELRNVTRKGVIEDISLTIKKGEILGVSGLMGSGRSELCRVIFGADRKDEGEIYVGGKKINIRSPIKAIKCNMAYLPENRNLHGLNVENTVINNMTYPILKSKRMNRLRIFVKRKEQEKICRKYVSALNVKLAGIYSLAKSLSGGNQQKVVIGKWLATDSGIFIVDEPTRGIDVGAKREIIKILKELADRGTAILLVDSETPELIELSDRIIVLKEGRIVAELNANEASHANLLKYSTIGG